MRKRSVRFGSMQTTRIICLISLSVIAIVGDLSCSKKADKSAEQQLSLRQAPVAEADQAKPINLVLISIDTLRRDRLTVYGYAKETSDAIERLAKESVVFDSAITAQTNTAPSHATVLTGLFPGSHGILQNGMRLKDDIPTMASILKARGYATGGFVSGWTLSPHTQLQRGFDEYNAAFRGSRRAGIDTWAFAKRWLRQHARGDKPLFFFLHLFEPHFPYDPPPQFALKFLPNQKQLEAPTERKDLPGLKVKLKLKPKEEREYDARYDGEIVSSDRIVESVLKELQRLRIRNKTLLVLFSDHGETLFERDWVADHGGRVYDEQLLVPLMIRFPDKERAGVRIEQQVMLVDVLPTVFDWMRIDTPRKIEGRSLLPLIRGVEKDKTPRAAFSHGRPEPVRVPEIGVRLTKRGILSSIRLPNAKLIEYPLEGGGVYQQLFDLEKDPGERVNIAKRRPDLVEKLHKQLSRWRIQTGVEKQPIIPRLTKEIEKGLRSLGYVE
jgi:arylsulfatase A-like enzyme